VKIKSSSTVLTTSNEYAEWYVDVNSHENLQDTIDIQIELPISIV
jgi:hypothetical protein